MVERGVWGFWNYEELESARLERLKTVRSRVGASLKDCRCVRFTVVRGVHTMTRLYGGGPQERAVVTMEITESGV